MALTKCHECGHSISDDAKFCPNCGAKPKKTSLVTKVVGSVFILFVAVSVYNSVAYNESASTGDASNGVESEVASEASNVEQSKSTWIYRSEKDSMGRGEIKWAQVKSINSFEFEFPYQGEQYATLELRKHPKYGRDVILSIERGQFLCGTQGCKVEVSFGDGKPVTFNAVESEDHSTTYLFLRNSDKFVAGLKKVDSIAIESTFFRQGTRVMRFSVSKLDWK